jgi:hypothetical protein
MKTYAAHTIIFQEPKATLEDLKKENPKVMSHYYRFRCCFILMLKEYIKPKYRSFLKDEYSLEVRQCEELVHSVSISIPFLFPHFNE